MTIAAYWGTTSSYTYNLDGTVMVETPDHRIMSVSEETFEYLYFKLDEFTAALKEDCVRYVINKPGTLLRDLPKWYSDLIIEGTVYILDGIPILNEESGEIEMAKNSVLMQNYKGDLRYLEGFKFHQYYNTLEDYIL